MILFGYRDPRSSLQECFPWVLEGMCWKELRVPCCTGMCLIYGMLIFRAGCQVVMAAAALINQQEVQEVLDDSDEDQVDQHEEDLVRSV